MSTRSGGRGRGPSVPRYPGVRMYRDDYRRDRPDDRRSNRYNNDEEGGDNYGGNSYGGGNDYYNSGYVRRYFSCGLSFPFTEIINKQ